MRWKESNSTSIPEVAGDAAYFVNPYIVTEIMKVFDDSQAWNLPVVMDGKFIGLISKSKLYSEYRKLMVQLSDE